MFRTIKKILIITGVTLIVMVVVGAAAAWWKFRQIEAERPPIETVGPLTVAPAASSPLGTHLTATINYRCPWQRFPDEAVFTPGPGIKLVGTPEIRRVAWGFGYNTWQVRAEFRPYHVGKLEGSTLETAFSRQQNATTTETRKISLPTLNISPLKPDDPARLDLAPVLDRQKNISRQAWLIGGGIVLLALLALLAYVHFRRRRQQRLAPLTPWQEALLELAGLRHDLSARVLQAEVCFGRLTDIVRNYLEKRFQLRAPQQTTQEFLADLNRSGSPLDGDQRCFLRDFLIVADEVKFAGIPADGELLDQAIASAETLVNQTKEQEEKP